MRTNKQQHEYRELLMNYRKYILLEDESDSDDPEFYLKLERKVKDLANEDSEFRHVLKKIAREHGEYLMIQLKDIPSLLRKLKEFSEGTPVELNTRSLLLFGYLYHDDAFFQHTCEADRTLHKAVVYWLDRYQQRIETDEMFAGHAIFWKLRTFCLVKYELEAPLELSQQELELLNRLYHTNSEFRSICDNGSTEFHEGVTYWLEEYRRRN
ncbi:MAG: hypothetical protein GY801_52930 [bacterium]|nr:hypothetical protein [bacterium]